MNGVIHLGLNVLQIFYDTTNLQELISIMLLILKHKLFDFTFE